MSRMITDALGYKPASSTSFGNPVQNISTLIAIASSELVDKQLRLVEDAGSLYRFDAESVLEVDGTRCLRATTLPLDSAGRWLLVEAPTQEIVAGYGLKNVGENNVTELAIDDSVYPDPVAMSLIFGS